MFQAQYQPTTLTLWQAVIEAFPALSVLTPAAREEFEAGLEAVSFAQDEMITEYGQIEQSLYLISEGATAVLVPKEGQEVVIDLNFAGEMEGALISFESETFSPADIRAVLPTKAWRVSRRLMVEMRKHESFREAEAIFLREEILHKARREKEFLTLTAMQRYEKLLRRNGSMVNQIPLKHIAGFLGIRPDSLSRLRKRLRDGE